MSFCIRLEMYPEKGREAYRRWRKHCSRSPGASLGCGTIIWLSFPYACLSVMARCSTLAAVLGVCVRLFSRPLTCGFNRRIESHQKHFPHPQLQIPARPWEMAALAAVTQPPLQHSIPQLQIKKKR